MRVQTQLRRDGGVLFEGAVSQTSGLHAIDREPDLRLVLFGEQKVVRHRLLQHIVGTLHLLFEYNFGNPMGAGLASRDIIGRECQHGQIANQPYPIE